MSSAAAALPGAKATGATLQTQGVFLPGISEFFNSIPATTTKPKAYLNWVLFDEQFKYVAEGSNSDAVPEEAYFLANNSVYTHLKPNLPISKSGYVYVYVSNETPNINVYFDNLQVSHTRGPLLEETHYYPFGLTMSGISSKALNGAPENKRKWNKGSELQSKELTDGSGLELYSTQYRSLDPQLGRFWQIDPRPDYSQSLYSSMSNNPISFNDPLGDSINNSRDQRTAARIEAGINRQVARNNQSITNSQNTITGNNTKLTKLRADVASGSLIGKNLKRANKKIGKLESSNNTANANITEMQGQNAQLNQSLADINSLRTDVNFNYTFGGAPGFGSGEHGVLRGSGNNVIIQGSDDGLNLHEIRHIGQSLANGGLRFSTNTATFGRLINAGSPDRARSNAFEVDAYQAQFSFDRNSYPAPGGARVLSDINLTSLRTIIGDSGGILY
jgi:RHS repeat-associated protein